jgi:hypothetical protein
MIGMALTLGALSLSGAFVLELGFVADVPVSARSRGRD